MDLDGFMVNKQFADLSEKDITCLTLVLTAKKPQEVEG